VSGSGLLLCDTLGEEGIVFCLLLCLCSPFPALESVHTTLALESQWGDKALNLGGLAARLSVRVVGVLRRLDLTDDILPHIVLLGQVEQPSNLGSTLGSVLLGDDGVGQSWDALRTKLDDDHSQDSDIGADDATTNGLALAFTISAGSVARMAGGQEELDTVRDKDTLLHRETLLVVATGDAEDVALELVSDSVTRHFLAHTLVVENTVSALILDVEELLLPSGRVGDIELHFRSETTEYQLTSLEV